MTTDMIAVLIASMGTLISIIVNLSTLRDRNSKGYGEIVEIKVDIKHIKSTVDKMENVPGRVTILEQQYKMLEEKMKRYEDERKA